MRGAINEGELWLSRLVAMVDRRRRADRRTKTGNSSHWRGTAYDHYSILEYCIKCSLATSLSKYISGVARIPNGFWTGNEPFADLFLNATKIKSAIILLPHKTACFKLSVYVSTVLPNCQCTSWCCGQMESSTLGHRKWCLLRDG